MGRLEGLPHVYNGTRTHVPQVVDPPPLRAVLASYQHDLVPPSEGSVARQREQRRQMDGCERWDLIFLPDLRPHRHPWASTRRLC